MKPDGIIPRESRDGVTDRPPPRSPIVLPDPDKPEMPTLQTSGVPVVVKVCLLFIAILLLVAMLG